MNEMDVFNNSEVIIQNKEEKIYIKFIIIVIILTSLLIGLIFIKYPKIYYFEGVTNDNEIVLFLTKKELKYLKGDKLIINDKEEFYNIDSIVELDNEIDYVKYYSVRVGTNLEFTDNDIVDFSIKDGYTNIYKNFLKKLWKGLNNG